MTNEELSRQLYFAFPEEQRKEVMTFENECDLCPEFMGFVDTYWHLSQMIPKSWTVVDIGCAFASQCMFFKNHARYIAVEPYVKHIFHCDNTEWYHVTAQMFIEQELPKLHLDMDKTFAICNNVPDWYRENPRELCRKVFKNLYCYYTKS